ncbi:hypothetical protein BH20BAC1_BH20BAC1_02690 [soil metagenome]
MLRVFAQVINFSSSPNSPIMQSRNSENEATSLLEKLLEQSKYQNQLLGNITNFLEVMSCQLEKISRQSCESLNELHWQTEMQKSLLKDITFILEIYKSKNPEAVSRIKELEELKKKIEECCPGDKEKEKRICKYEPCEKEEDKRPKSAELDRGRAIPERVKGAPFEPVKKKDDYKNQPNYRPGKKTPRGKFKGLISETKGSALKDMATGDDSPDPVIFGKYTETTITNLASTNAADISGSDNGDVVMLTGNWYVQYSTDGGQNFTTLDPTTIFPDNLAGGFCCDQIIQYVPSIDRFIWLLQYSRSGGTNAYRLAAASTQDIIDSNCTAWTYWDLTSASFNLGTDWMDYPSMSVGNNSLYISCDAANAGGGLLVVRIPLSEIQSGSTINFQYTNHANAVDARGGNVSQNALDEVFWAGNVDNSTIRIWSMKENSNTYFWRDVDVSNWPNSTLASNGPNGNDWLDYNMAAAGWQFPDDAIIGITRRGNELWMAWTASSGNGGFGGFNFPHPHVQVVKVNIDNYTVIEQMQIWNPDLAFAYPSFATNSENEVGITLGWGGGGTFHANSAVGIMGDFVVWFRNGSTWTHTRWGDYVTCRRSSPDPRLFAGFGFVTYQDATVAAGRRFDPYYVLFGRKSKVIPPIG